MSMFWIGYAAGFVTFPVVFGLLALGFLLLVPHWPNPTCGLSYIPCDETLIEDDRIGGASPVFFKTGVSRLFLISHYFSW